MSFVHSKKRADDAEPKEEKSTEKLEKNEKGTKTNQDEDGAQNNEKEEVFFQKMQPHLRTFFCRKLGQMT